MTHELDGVIYVSIPHWGLFPEIDQAALRLQVKQIERRDMMRNIIDWINKKPTNIVTKWRTK